METINGTDPELEDVQILEVWDATFPGDEEVQFTILFEIFQQEYWVGWNRIGEWKQLVAPMGDVMPCHEECEEFYLRITRNFCGE
jgi:hypothetical protein